MYRNRLSTPSSRSQRRNAELWFFKDSNDQRKYTSTGKASPSRIIVRLFDRGLLFLFIFRSSLERQENRQRRSPEKYGRRRVEEFLHSSSHRFCLYFAPVPSFLGHVFSIIHFDRGQRQWFDCDVVWDIDWPYKPIGAVGGWKYGFPPTSHTSTGYAHTLPHCGIHPHPPAHSAVYQRHFVVLPVFVLGSPTLVFFRFFFYFFFSSSLPPFLPLVLFLFHLTFVSSSLCVGRVPTTMLSIYIGEHCQVRRDERDDDGSSDASSPARRASSFLPRYPWNRPFPLDRVGPFPSPSPLLASGTAHASAHPPSAAHKAKG